LSKEWIEVKVKAKPKTKSQIQEFWDLWKRVKQVYPEKGKLEQETILGQAYGVSWRTIERWMERLARPEETLFTPQEEFLSIDFVKNWYDRLQDQAVRQKYKDKVFGHVKDLWQNAGNKEDPRLWTKETIDRFIKYLVDKGLSEGSIQHAKVALKKFLRESDVPSLIKLEPYVKVGAMAKRRGIEEKFHRPVTREEFLLLESKMPEACRSFYESLQTRGAELSFSLEWLQKLMNTAIWVGVSTGARTGNWKEGRDLLGITVINDPDRLREVLTPKGKKTASYVLVIDGKIRTWHFLAKWYLYWNKIYMLPEVTSKIEEWIKYAGLKHGDPLFPIASNRYNTIFKRAGRLTGLPFKITHHNLRSTFLVWTCESDIDLEIAIDFGVGWDTIDTARKFYLMWRKKKYEDEAQKLFKYVGALFK